MAETKSCPKCGAKLLDDAPSGICPKCLMLAGLESEQDAGSSSEVKPTTLTSGFVPPEPEVLAKHFPQLEIMELLGKGGMGAVYKARQPGLDRLVAVKILPPEIGADPAFAERFTREARALAKLSHQNIVQIYDFGRNDEFFHFIMEYVDGANLRYVIETGALKPEEALAIVPQICEALQFAHDEGIVHRDIKPENILVDRQGRVKIADFGLAKLLGKSPADVTLTGTHQAMGTVHYMAPEQMQEAASVDHRADIFSLGVVFYEMLTGQLPIGKFDPPSKKVQVDVRLDEVVLRSLESEPDRRYQHVTDLQTDVESIASDTRPITRIAEVSDSVMFRRLTKFNLILGSIWSAIIVAFNWGYVAEADWYFKEEVPYTALGTLFFMFSIWLVMCSATWWYLLAKRPDTPRSVADFCRLAGTPDQRMRRIWKPGLVYGGIWLLAVVISWPYGDTAQLVCHSTGFILLPFVGMAITRWAYAERRFQRAAEVKTDVENISRGAQAVPAPAPSRPTRLSEAETQAARDRVMAPAISLTILSGLLILFAILIGLAAIGVSVWYGSSRRGPVLWYGWWFPSGDELDMWKRLISLALIQIPLLPFGLILFVGALRMRRLESYGLAMTASYVSVLLGGLDLLICGAASSLSLQLIGEIVPPI
jgi:predicted Ser/Thr protein kinase